MEEQNNKHRTPKDQKRRNILKGMASLPILGLFGLELSKSKVFVKKAEPFNILSDLGMDQELHFDSAVTSTNKPKDQLRIGIIGAGGRGHNLLHNLGFGTKDDLESLSENGMKSWLEYGNLNLALAGVCDVFDERAESALATAKNSASAMIGEKSIPKAQRYKHHHELLASDEIDAVIIATPDHHHAQMTIDAINAGKHVYCEKAPTRTEEEIYRLAATLENCKPVYQLGHQIRHNPIYPYAADLINKGILGEVNLVEVTTNRNTSSGAWVRHLNPDGTPKSGDANSIDWDQWLGDRPKVPFSIDKYYNWTKYFDYATGLLGQLFSHEFDAVNGLLSCGIPHSCVCTGGIYYYKDGREIPDLMHAVFEYPDKGMTLVYSATLANSLSRGRVIMGRDASMEIGSTISVTADNNSVRYKDKIEKKLIDPSVPILTVGPEGGNQDATTSATEKYYVDRGLTSVSMGGKTKDITHLHLKEWVDVIRNGGQVSCGLDRAFQEAVTIQMAKKSYFENRRVVWDPISRKIV